CVHYFRFYTTLHMSWITGSSGVTLSVTGTHKYIKSITWITFQNEAFMNAYVLSDLQVKEGVVGKTHQTELTCSTSCSLSSNTQYVWYKNGQPLRDKTTASIPLDSSRPIEANSYSCAVR